ncbi:MAG: spore germination protein, partial [Clostridia bacterium]|nr:spore germination protein [Clostridia bacterium]
LLLRNPDSIPSFFSVAFPDSLKGPPILFQLLLVEFTIDALKLASLNTPSSLGSSLSVVAGLIIGDFAVQTGWLSGEVILYMSFVAMANFTQPSYELGYAFKFSRVLLLILISIADLLGFIIGLALIVTLIVFGRRINSKYSYLYPILPFNKRALKRQLLRVKLTCGKKK